VKKMGASSIRNGQAGRLMHRRTRTTQASTQRFAVYKANQDRLGPDPHDRSALRVGMELDIPVKTSRVLWNEPLPAPRH